MIAKYRREGFPGEWYLTDFTMEQVEGRLEYLEAETIQLRKALQMCYRSLCAYIDNDPSENGPYAKYDAMGAVNKAHYALGVKM